MILDIERGLVKMASEQVADMTVEELKAIIAEVVNQQISEWMNYLNNSALISPGYYMLPKRTEEEQHQRNQALLEWHRKWVEEGDEEEQRETFEYLQKALDEDRLSNRPLFPKQ